MVQQLASPYSYFADSNGAPLSGGLIYTYQAGTTTPQATYTTFDINVPNANPVVLDSAGRAQIWLSGSYKIVVKDSLGNTISTTDNITANSGATGDMQKATYDPAGINEQLVGLAAPQILTNKTLNQPTINQPLTVGVTDASDAAAGKLGEYISSIILVGAAVSLVTGTGKNITSISLSAGDWDVGGHAQYHGTGTTTTTTFIAGISTTSNTIGNSKINWVTTPNTPIQTGDLGLIVPVNRISVATPTTVYLVTAVAFAVSTLSAYGELWARRVR